ncbi:hypothetical protein BHE74_00054917 [Ensete ventricosum]|nr:hypothetical protein BHE74_00054917 [Ensete ventricosum]
MDHYSNTPPITATNLATLAQREGGEKEGAAKEWELVRMSGDSELDLGGRLLELWSPGEEGVLQFGSGAEAFIVGAVDHSYLITLLLLWLTMLSYSSTMLVVLVMRREFAGRGCRPYLCQVGCTSTIAPHTSVRPVARVESATSAGQLSEGMITWRPGQHLSYHSSPSGKPSRGA